jgi:hypothetical protein
MWWVEHVARAVKTRGGNRGMVGTPEGEKVLGMLNVRESKILAL